MTTAGLQILNDSFTFQVDQTYKNQALVSKTSPTMTSASTFNPPNGYGCSVTITAVHPIVAFACSAPCCLYSASHSGSSFTFNFYAQDPGTGTPTITVYIFDDVDQATITDNFGLEVFDASGNRVFHSSQQPLRIVDGQAFADPDDSTLPMIDPGPTSFTYTSGHSYAVIPSSAYVRNETYLSDTSYGSLPPGKSWYEDRQYKDGASVASNVVTLDVMTVTISHHSAGPADATTESAHGQLQWLIIDVTNY